MIIKSLQLFTLVHVFVLVKGCGISTHISIAHEALTFFKSSQQIDFPALLKKHQDAFIAGNTYPDALYPDICFEGKYHSVAEDTHWAPFLNATIVYIRKTYPPPWSLETEKLIAFVFGFVSHQVADITWHSLGLSEGFLDAMASTDFNGIYDAAHTVGDFGGDILSQLDKDDAPVDVFKWYVPVHDLYNIYNLYYNYNVTIPKYVIGMCSKLLYLAYLAESIGGAKIFKISASKSPFLFTQLHEYFLGGVHDMASWTTKIWVETAYMLEHGTDNCNMEDSPLLIRCKGSYMLKTKPVNRHVFQYSLSNSSLLELFMDEKLSRRGVYFTPNAAFKSFKKTLHPSFQHINLKGFFSKMPYANAGRSMILLKIKGQKMVVIGAPNYGIKGFPQIGCVYFVPLDRFISESSRSLEDVSEQVFDGYEMMGKFGWSLTSVNYNDDEFEDLVISAPTSGAAELKYTGKVYIYFGSENGFNNKPSLVLDYYDENCYTNYGFYVVGCSKNLFVGNPFSLHQVGFVEKIDKEKRMHFKNPTAQNYSLYGQSISCKQLGSKSVLAVGSPKYRKCYLTNCTYHILDKQSAGRVDVYFNGKFSSTLSSDKQFAEFGSSLSFGYPFGNKTIVLAVSSPAKDVEATFFGVQKVLKQAGEVTLYQFDSDFKNVPKIIARYQSDRAYSRFGETVKFVDLDKDGKDELLISAPRRTIDLTEEVFGGEEGAVYIFNIFSGDVTSECFFYEMNPCPGAKARKVLLGKEAHSRFGSSFITVGSQIIISSPQSSYQAFHGGRVQAYDLL